MTYVFIFMYNISSQTLNVMDTYTKRINLCIFPTLLICSFAYNQYNIFNIKITKHLCYAFDVICVQQKRKKLRTEARIVLPAAMHAAAQLLTLVAYLMSYASLTQELHFTIKRKSDLPIKEMSGILIGIRAQEMITELLPYSLISLCTAVTLMICSLLPSTAVLT
ncbi:hypothetical protein ACJX0J_029889 [Zea mays]